MHDQDVQQQVQGWQKYSGTGRTRQHLGRLTTHLEDVQKPVHRRTDDAHILAPPGLEAQLLQLLLHQLPGDLRQDEEYIRFGCRRRAYGQHSRSSAGSTEQDRPWDACRCVASSSRHALIMRQAVLGFIFALVQELDAIALG